MLARLDDETFDLLVVGGGVTGAGVALDAATRGLRTALVEADDFASGTSSKSSKLVHGGLRYLQQGDIRLVYEALHERQRLRRNAPHLVHLLPFMIPIMTRDGLIPRRVARALGSAMWMYDLTGGFRIGKLHKRLKADAAFAHLPTMPRERLAGGYLYYDATTDDARLVLTIARTAADHGAVVVNRARVVGFTKDADGQVDGATVDADGRQVVVRATVVVNAAGVWADELRELEHPAAGDTIRPAKGIHITVPWDLIRNDIAAVVPVPRDRRSVFVVPWGKFTYIGTTDTDYDGPVDDPQCRAEDVEYLLRAINTAITTTITEADITGTWAGLRPLVKSVENGRTADLSRRHRVASSSSGMVTVTGGKLTTYREMAADTIDDIAELLGHRPGKKPTARASRTKRLELRGAAGYSAVRAGGDGRTVHLADRYGGEARTVLAMIDKDPTLGRPLVAGLPYVRAEAVYAARHEMARSVDDVLTRRTRARLLDGRAAAAAADDVAELIGGILGHGPGERAAQAAAFRAAVLHERSSMALPEAALEPSLGA